MDIRRLTPSEIPLLTELFPYRAPGEMIAACTRDLKSGKIEIFGLFDGSLLIGELRVMLENEDPRFAVRGLRAYLYAFRIREAYRGKGCGRALLTTVLESLERDGYRAFTIGVEDDNAIALHLYHALGFCEFVLRKEEEYQGDRFTFSLLERRLPPASSLADGGDPS